MKKAILTLALLLTLTGCGYVGRMWAQVTSYSLICVKDTGVMYVQFASGAAVLVDQSGKPQACR